MTLYLCQLLSTLTDQQLMGYIVMLFLSCFWHTSPENGHSIEITF